MGTADVKYGDSLVYLQHMKSAMWLSYQTFETKKRGVGRVEEKKVTGDKIFNILHKCLILLYATVARSLFITITSLVVMVTGCCHG